MQSHRQLVRTYICCAIVVWLSFCWLAFAVIVSWWRGFSAIAVHFRQLAQLNFETIELFFFFGICSNPNENSFRMECAPGQNERFLFGNMKKFFFSPLFDKWSLFLHSVWIHPLLCGSIASILEAGGLGDKDRSQGLEKLAFYTIKKINITYNVHPIAAWVVECSTYTHAYTFFNWWINFHANLQTE